MAYVSLYRKYRPQVFAEVVGQGHVTTTLANAVAEGRPHHAYLFTGPRGTGKTSTARILAKALNCERGPTPTPCNACATCSAITGGSHVDVMEIDAASHGGVDDVRDLRDRVALAPAGAHMKVYIVDECHMLSVAGWNAFLKTVEEPPGHVVFVFATTEPHKVLDTILSRTQRFDFKRVDTAALTAHLLEVGAREGLDFEPGAVDLVVRAGDGSVRDALSVLDQVVAFTGSTVTLRGVAEVLGAVPEALLIEAGDLIAAGDVAGLCILVQRLADSGQDLRQFARDAVEHLRAVFLLQVAPDAQLVAGSPERLGRLATQAQRLGPTELLRAVELLAEAQAQMRRGNTRLPLELALVKAALPEATGDPATLAARLERLERRTGVDPPPAPAPSQQPATPAPVSVETPQPDSPTPASVETSQPASPAPASVETPPGENGSPGDRKSSSPGGGEPVLGVDLELVTRSWPAVLEATKSRSRRLHAFLLQARAADVSDSMLVLEFPPGYGFHAEHCASEASQAMLGEVLVEVLGVRLRLRCRVADGDDRPPPVGDGHADASTAADEALAVLETEAAEAAGELPGDAEAHELAIETLRRSMGAAVIEDQ